MVVGKNCYTRYFFLLVILRFFCMNMKCLFRGGFYWVMIMIKIKSSSRYFLKEIYYYFTPLDFFPSVLADGFSLDFERQQVPSSLQDNLSILAVLRNAVVWIVSTCPPTSKSSRPFNNPLVIVPNAPITIGTIVTFMFHSFFSSLAKSRYLSFFSFFFRFILWSSGTAKSTILQILFFLLIIMRSSRD